MIPACTHSAVPVRDLVIAPVAVLGLPAERGEVLRRSLEQEAGANEKVRRVAPAVVDAALQDEDVDCLDTDPCLAGVGQRVGADQVLAVSLGGLGDTYLVRSKLIAVAGALLLQDVQETVVGGPEEVSRYARILVARLYPPEAEVPWYRSWWVWTIIGGAAVTVAGTATLAVVLSQGPPPEALHLGDL